MDKSGDVKVQTREVLCIAQELFDEAGTNEENLLRAEIYVKDINRDFKAFNETWDNWVSKKNPPTRACVEANMSTPQTLVEIISTAIKIT